MAKIIVCSQEEWDNTPGEMGFPQKESYLAPSPIVGITTIGEYRKVHTKDKKFNTSIGALKEAGLDVCNFEENTHQVAVRGFNIKITPMIAKVPEVVAEAPVAEAK